MSIVPGLLHPKNHSFCIALGVDGRPTRRLIVTDHLVWTLYGEALSEYVHHHEVTCDVVKVDSVESKKRMEQVLAIVDACDSSEVLRRQMPIVAFGGGTVLDLAGLSANLYRRGVPYVRIPTTLVGMIDAGIGIKTGVNHGGKKSLLGTYHPPSAVLIDPAFLASLNPSQVASGLAEAIKIALVRDAGLFELIEENASALIGDFVSTPSHRALMSESITAMLGELGDNLWEHRLERLADFGHTFSPGIEMAAVPRLTHGESVALDIAFSCLLSVRRGLLSESESRRIHQVLEEVGLPTDDEVVTLDLLASSLESASRHRDGLQRVPLLTSIGRATFVNDISRAELGRALEMLRSRRASS